MKKLSSLIIALFVLSAGTVFAQSSDNADITASANVVQAITVNAGDNLTFGNVLPGVAGTIDIVDADGSLNSNNAGSPQLGTFTISGGEGASISITFSALTELTGVGNAANSLPFDYAGTNFARHEGATTADTNFDPTAGTSIELGTGDVTIKVGGEVTPDNNQAQDTYEGTITLTATYDSI